MTGVQTCALPISTGHAAAGIHQDAEADGGAFGGELGDGPWAIVFEDGEVRLRQPGDPLPSSIGDGDLQDAQRYLSRLQKAAPQTARSLALGIRIERALGDQDKVASYELALRNQFPDSAEAAELARGGRAR